MRTITPTLAIIVAGGLAAGIALARPATNAPEPAARVAVEEAPLAGGGFLGGGAASEGGFLGAGDGAPAEAQAGPPADLTSAELTIVDFAFGTPLTVAAGTEVSVTNADTAPHTVTADDGGFDTRNVAGGAAAVFVAPTTPGVHAFACAIHPSMRGELVVES